MDKENIGPLSAIDPTDGTIAEAQDSSSSYRSPESDPNPVYPLTKAARQRLETISESPEHYTRQDGMHDQGVERTAAVELDDGIEGTAGYVTEDDDTIQEDDNVNDLTFQLPSHITLGRRMPTVRRKKGQRSKAADTAARSTNGNVDAQDATKVMDDDASSHSDDSAGRKSPPVSSPLHLLPIAASVEPLYADLEILSEH